MKQDILISTPARRYARAMMEVAIKQRNFTHVLEEIELFHQQLLDTPILRQLFLNPAVTLDRKARILEEISTRLKFQELTRNFLKTLMHRDRLGLLEEIIASAELQFLERQGIVVVEVTTARKLDTEEHRGLIARLEAFTGKKVQLENSVDPSLVGGAVTRIGTTIYDGSVLAHLGQLKQRIIQS